VAPWSDSPQVEESVNMTDVALTMPAGYLLYDNFVARNDDIWIAPSYRPSSTFIDTTFVPEGVTFSNGDLVLKSDVDRHLGAEYKTKGKFLYGKYRASMRLDQTPGTYMTFFLYTPDPGNHNEIDIELIKTGNTTTARLTTWVNMVKNERNFRLSFDPSRDYHLYGFDWHKDRVDFFIDDMKTPVWTSTSQVPQGACYLYLNSWVVTKVPADHGNGANTQYVDWVTVQPENGA
jgi:beta-glucanase (GH16 family)